MNKIYVYSLWSGRFICTECTLKPSTWNGLACAINNVNNARTQISNSPEVIHNGVVWFLVRDDHRAAELLIAYQNQQISKLEKRIDNYKHKIEVLSKEIKEESYT